MLFEVGGCVGVLMDGWVEGGFAALSSSSFSLESKELGKLSIGLRVSLGCV